MSDATDSLERTTQEYVDKSLELVHEMAARIIVLEAENERLDSWDGMMEIASRHYPMDVDYFASSPDPGCRNIRSLNAINDERTRAESAEDERDKARCEANLSADNCHSAECVANSLQTELAALKVQCLFVCGWCENNCGRFCDEMDRDHPKQGRCFVQQPCHLTPSCWVKRMTK